MGWFQRTFDPNTAAENDRRKAQNAQTWAKALGENAAYKNKGVSFRQAQWGAGTDLSVANSNVQSQALKNQYAAFTGFEEFARQSGKLTGPTGEGSRTAERGRTANYMVMLSKRNAIEKGLRDSFGAEYHSALHQNAVRSQNQIMAARDKLGIRPSQRRLEGMKKTNYGIAAFNVAKTGLQIYAGAAAFSKGTIAGPSSKGGFGGGLSSLSKHLFG